MSQINQVELQNLRHLIGIHEMSYNKLNTYADQCQDQEVKKVFQKSAQDAMNVKNQLLSFLK